MKTLFGNSKIIFFVFSFIIYSSCSDNSHEPQIPIDDPVVVDSAALAKLHLTMGNPSGAVKDTLFFSNYLMEKPEYVLSYNRNNGTANWVAWHLNNDWRGNVSRQDNFRNDISLPAGWYQVQSTSYSGSGYDRGHICPSADRTSTVQANSATFLMTNIIPQAPNNNQGPWADMENYLRSLISSGKEMYIYAGGFGSNGRIDNGHVNVPSHTWKVVVVLDSGENDLNRVSNSTRLISVYIPNDNDSVSMTSDWKSFRVKTDFIESQTGYDFLSNVPSSIQSVIESVVDNQ